jgi:hypothetical protein
MYFSLAVTEVIFKCGECDSVEGDILPSGFQISPTFTDFSNVVQFKMFAFLMK